MTKSISYDSSWDAEGNEDAFDRKMEEWEERDWGEWLGDNLTFPFEAIREEDMDEEAEANDDGPFAVGCSMQVTGLGEEEFPAGVFVYVQVGKAKGCIPLADMEVIDNKDPNYWLVREYAVWMANH